MIYAKPNIVSDAWVDGVGVKQDINPSGVSEVVSEFNQASKAQTDEAIAAAKAASFAWGLSTPQQRCDALEMIGTELLARKDEIGRILSRENGKPLSNGVGETIRAAQIFKFFAQEALRIEGTQLPSLRPNVDVTITLEPMGVVGLLCPLNFPIAIPPSEHAPPLCS